MTVDYLVKPDYSWNIKNDVGSQTLRTLEIWVLTLIGRDRFDSPSGSRALHLQCLPTQ